MQFKKKNAEKNIDKECAILTAEENQKRLIARAMEEYSAVLKERDELRLRAIELEHEIGKYNDAQRAKYLGCLRPKTPTPPRCY